jgi:formylglycine-generating enzyme required for sulfatase activity
VTVTAPSDAQIANRVEGFTDPITGMEFVPVPQGCFTANGKQTCINAFHIGKFEVTQGQYKRIMGSNPSRFSSCGDDCPVEMVSWDDAQSFISKLNSQAGKRFRLPTEAEWEYACRSGGKNEAYCGGNDVNAVAWYDNISGSKTHAVGQKQPNGLGI